MLQNFSRREVSKILSIKTGRLQYWDRIGLVKPSFRKKGNSYYTFQDLICLKTAGALVGKGLPARKIKLSIDSLRKRIPESDDHLNSKRIHVFGNRIIISHRNQLIDTQSGQLFFRFDVDDFAADIRRKVSSFEPHRDAEDWFQEGLRCDGSKETYEQALHAYRQVLKLDPSFADAYVNMGTIYYNEGRFADAEHCYRLALAQDPDHAEAYFNLGNAMDELDRTQEAVKCYERALELNPNYPDAHFNLASACEKLELWERAIKHWKRYLAFDQQSRYAAAARRRIKFLKSQRNAAHVP